MRRVSFSLILGMIALIITAFPAGAGVSWCRADPIVRLNGTDVQIWVAVPEQYAPLVNGPIDVQIGTPGSVTREVILLDAGFNGHGETVRFTDIKGGTKGGTFEMKVEIQVPIDVSGLPAGTLIPVQVEVIPFNASPVYFDGTHARTSFSMKIQGGT